MNFEHDCKRCIYLGSIDFPSARVSDMAEWTVQVKAALYICEDVLGPTLIARFSSEGSDYASCPASIVKDQYLTMEEYCSSSVALIAAYYFARAKRLLK